MDSALPTPCTSNTAHQLVGINDLAITATSATPACNASATGTINVTYTGGIGTVFYSLNGGAFVAAPAGNPFTITGLVGSGSPYTIELMDSAMPTPCTSSPASQLVGINDLAFTGTLSTPSCIGESTGTINVTYTGGIETIFYRSTVAHLSRRLPATLSLSLGLLEEERRIVLINGFSYANSLYIKPREPISWPNILQYNTGYL